MSWLLFFLAFRSVDEPAGPLREAGSCPRVFGTEQDKKTNAKQRKAWIKRVSFEKEETHIIQFADFSDPKRLALNGIEVVFEAAGLVTLLPALASEADCLPGVYRVDVDDNLGVGTAVIGTGDGVLLLHREDQLWYVIPEQAKEPVFRVTWEARFTLPRSFTRPPAPATPAPPTRPRGK